MIGIYTGFTESYTMCIQTSPRASPIYIRDRLHRDFLRYVPHSFNVYCVTTSLLSCLDMIRSLVGVMQCHFLYIEVSVGILGRHESDVSYKEINVFIQPTCKGIVTLVIGAQIFYNMTSIILTSRHVVAQSVHLRRNTQSRGCHPNPYSLRSSFLLDKLRGLLPKDI